MNEKHLKKRDTFKSIKRIAITLLCCIPILGIVGYFLLGKVSNTIMIIIFISILCVVLGIEELIHIFSSQKRAEKLINNKHTDVFK